MTKRKVKQPTTIMVNARVPVAVLKRIDEAAKLQSRTRSNFVIVSAMHAADAVLDAKAEATS